MRQRKRKCEFRFYKSALNKIPFLMCHEEQPAKVNSNWGNTTTFQTIIFRIGLGERTNVSRFSDLHSKNRNQRLKAIGVLIYSQITVKTDSSVEGFEVKLNYLT